MSADFIDRFEEGWVLTMDLPEQGHWRWMRVSDGCSLEVTPKGVDLHGTLMMTDDPAGWLSEHLGAPPLDLGDLAAIRRRNRLNEAFWAGWDSQWRASGDREPYTYSYLFPPRPRTGVDDLRSVPT